VAESRRGGEVRLYGKISNDFHALERLFAKLGGEGVTLHVVYEAGPTGFVIYRRLMQRKIDCIVVAPSKTPQPAGIVRRRIGVTRCSWPGCTEQGSWRQSTCRMRPTSVSVI
jgi:transposase